MVEITNNGKTLNTKTFKYKLGPVLVDGWRFRTDNGDCDDFAYTISRLLTNGWVEFLIKLWTFQIVFWRVKSPTNGIIPRHIVVYVSEKADLSHNGYIDSTYRFFRKQVGPHRLRWPIIPPVVMLMLVVGGIYSFIFDR